MAIRLLSSFSVLDDWLELIVHCLKYVSHVVLLPVRTGYISLVITEDGSGQKYNGMCISTCIRPPFGKTFAKNGHKIIDIYFCCLSLYLFISLTLRPIVCYKSLLLVFFDIFSPNLSFFVFLSFNDSLVCGLRTGQTTHVKIFCLFYRCITNYYYIEY